MRIMTKDILVIGTGISGLAYAIQVAEENPNVSMVLISKSNLNEGNTRYAQGESQWCQISKKILLKNIF